jgi:hypothetical protein
VRGGLRPRAIIWGLVVKTALELVFAVLATMVLFALSETEAEFD